MIVLDCQQGTPEWAKARLGICTSSEFDKIITPARGEYSTQANGYMNRLIAEILTGKEATGFTSEWMERGIEMEAEARNWYEFMSGKDVKQVGFVYRDERKEVGCSPDGLGIDRGLEIKCPSPGVMVSYLLEGCLPREYIPQVQGSMMVTGFRQWDFVAYHPDFDPLLITVQRDDKYISTMEMYLARFNKEKAEKLNKLDYLVRR